MFFDVSHRLDRFVFLAVICTKLRWLVPVSLFRPILACVAGAKRGGRGGGRKALPFSLFPYPLPLSTSATLASPIQTM